MEKATRILVANHPKLMREAVLATLADQPGIEVVGEVLEEGQILKQVRDTHPDLLVIALDENEQRPSICDRVLQERPDLRIIAVASRKDRTRCFWASFDIHCADIETSTAGILGAVHDTARFGRRPS
jgi:DNA-binding NarL/FixJ family response regulator